MEAATLAFAPLGWKPLACAEIEPAPRALIAQRLPDTPLFGDFTLLRDMPELIVNADMLIGGTPCQGFSVAGLRWSLSDDRSNLCLEFVRLANAIDDLRRDAGREPCWITWENVPGVLSTQDNAFGAFLGGLVGSDAPLVSRGGWQYAGVVAGPRRCAAWRTLDAQHFGLAQRRLRVFVLAIEHPRGWSAPDALLPITESMRWHPAPRRETGERVAPTIAARTRGGGGLGTDAECDGALIPLEDLHLRGVQGGSQSDVVADMRVVQPRADIARALTAHASRIDAETETFVVANTLLGKSNSSHAADLDNYVTHSLRADGFDASEDGTGRGTPIIPILEVGKGTSSRGEGPNGVGIGNDGDPMYTLQAGAQHAIAHPYTLAIRGRGDSHELEYRQDGLANAVLTPNGGRAGIGVGAVAFDPTQITSAENRSNPQLGDPCHTLAKGQHAPAIAFSCKDHGADAGDISPTMRAMGHDGSHANAGGQVAVAFQTSGNCGAWETGDVTGAIDTMTDPNRPVIQTHWAVRRLTPKECERLQGAPDDWTNIAYRGRNTIADGPRYKMIGNSWAVPCVRYIGERIEAVRAQWIVKGRGRE